MALCPLSFLGRLKPFFSFWQRKKRMGSKRRSFGCGGRSEERADRDGSPYGCGGRSEVATMYCNCSLTLIRLLRRHLPRGEGNPLRRGRADRVVRPYGWGGRYAVAPMRWNCSQSLIRLLRRHLPRRGRQSAAAGIWADRVVRPYKKGVVGALQVSPKGASRARRSFG